MAYGKPDLDDLVLHLPVALRDRAEEMASRECVSLNLFLVSAVAEKLQRLRLQESLDISEHEELYCPGTPVGSLLIH